MPRQTDSNSARPQAPDQKTFRPMTQYCQSSQQLTVPDDFAGHDQRLPVGDCHSADKPKGGLRPEWFMGT